MIELLQNQKQKNNQILRFGHILTRYTHSTTTLGSYGSWQEAQINKDSRPELASKVISSLVWLDSFLHTHPINFVVIQANCWCMQCLKSQVLRISSSVKGTTCKEGFWVCNCLSAQASILVWQMLEMTPILVGFVCWQKFLREQRNLERDGYALFKAMTCQIL